MKHAIHYPQGISKTVASNLANRTAVNENRMELARLDSDVVIVGCDNDDDISCIGFWANGELKYWVEVTSSLTSMLIDMSWDARYDGSHTHTDDVYLPKIQTII